MAFYRIVTDFGFEGEGGICNTTAIVQANNPDEAFEIMKKEYGRYLDGAKGYLDDSEVKILEIQNNSGLIYSDANEYRLDEYNTDPNIAKITGEDPDKNEDYNGETMIQELIVKRKGFDYGIKKPFSFN